MWILITIISYFLLKWIVKILLYKLKQIFYKNKKSQFVFCLEIFYWVYELHWKHFKLEFLKWLGLLIWLDIKIIKTIHNQRINLFQLWNTDIIQTHQLWWLIYCSLCPELIEEQLYYENIEIDWIKFFNTTNLICESDQTDYPFYNDNIYYTNLCEFELVDIFEFEANDEELND